MTSIFVQTDNLSYQFSTNHFANALSGSDDTRFDSLELYRVLVLFHANGITQLWDSVQKIKSKFANGKHQVLSKRILEHNSIGPCGGRRPYFITASLHLLKTLNGSKAKTKPIAALSQCPIYILEHYTLSFEGATIKTRCAQRNRFQVYRI